MRGKKSDYRQIDSANYAIMSDAISIDKETFYSAYEISEDDSVIWRFPDSAKLIPLLKERALYLPRADKFEDQFEWAVCPLADAER